MRSILSIGLGASVAGLKASSILIGQWLGLGSMGLAVQSRPGKRCVVQIIRLVEHAPRLSIMAMG